MKYTSLLTSVLLISFALFLNTSCEKKDEIIPDEPFELIGEWTFNQVTTTAPILGDYTDSEPTGTITFNEDGSGSADYSFDVIGLLGQGVPVSRNDSFLWSRTGDIITIVANDDNTIIWTIVNEVESDFQTTWTESVQGIDAVDFHAYMIK